MENSHMENVIDASKPVRTNDNFLVFGAPQVQEEEIEEIVQSLRSGWWSTGLKVKRFEDDFKAYKGAQHAVALNSCTAALHLSLLAADVKAGDEVITTAMTFCSTVNAIIHSGATPVLADCDMQTRCIDPASIREKITAKTKAIVCVHFAGEACDMDEILAIAEEFDLKIIEDCAHAIETQYKGQHVGTLGDYGCFSFYVTKNVATGEGGMVLTKRKEDAARIKVLALHGMSDDAWSRYSDEGYKHYTVVHAGFKYNMMDLQAALGIHQLKRVDQNWQKRLKIWERYEQELAGLPLELPTMTLDECKHGLHLFTIQIDKEQAGVSRDEFLSRMNKEGVGTGVHYLSIPEHPYYQQTYQWKTEEYPVSSAFGLKTVSLPLSAKLTEADVSDVITAVKKVLAK